MLLTFANRLEMIKTLSNGRVNTFVELGVYKGEFAEFCARTLTPLKHVLVDFWDFDSYEFVLPDAPQNLDRDTVFNAYFDENPRETLQNAYDHVVKMFSGNSAVQILREDISASAQRFPDAFFEIIYLDGNHSYEFVLRDLYTWYPKLAPGGLFICNDFFESALAARQNIGVVPAFETFFKRFPVYPIALSMCEWSDLYFSNMQSSPLISRLCEGLASAGHNNLEVSVEFLGAYHHRLVKSEQGQYLLPSFAAR